MTLSENVAAGQAADAAMEFVHEIARSIAPELLSRFYENVARAAVSGCGLCVCEPAKTVIAVDNQARMSRSEAQDFESGIMTFGKYQGYRVGDIPASYWEMLKHSSFNRELERYMKSDRFRERREQEE